MTFSHFIKISGLVEINVDGKESAVINIHEKIEKADDQFWAKDVGTSTDGLFLTSGTLKTSLVMRVGFSTLRRLAYWVACQ